MSNNSSSNNNNNNNNSNSNNNISNSSSFIDRNSNNNNNNSSSSSHASMGMWNAYGINLYGLDIMPKSWTPKASVISMCSRLVHSVGIRWH